MRKEAEMRKKTLLFIGLIAMLFVMLVSCNTDQAVKISFDSQGGTRCKTITVDASAESIDLPTPTRDRYVFTGWYSDAELSTQVVDPIPAAMFPTEDVTYYAGWREVTYTVFFFVEDRKVGEKVFSYGGRLTADDYPSLSSYPGYEWKKDSFEVKSDKSVFAVILEMGLNRVRHLRGTVLVGDPVPALEMGHHDSGLIHDRDVHLPLLCIAHNEENDNHHGGEKNRNHECGDKE